jgi:hypothetical protein
MKVERKEKVDPVLAMTLESGDCFEFEEGVYMVVEVSTLEAECPECGIYIDGDEMFRFYSNSVAAICFDDNCVYKFSTEKVNPIKLKVVEV